MGNALVVGLVEQMGRRLKEEVHSIQNADLGRSEIRSERGAVKGPLDQYLDESMPAASTPKTEKCQSQSKKKSKSAGAGI